MNNQDGTGQRPKVGQVRGPDEQLRCPNCKRYAGRPLDRHVANDLHTPSIRTILSVFQGLVILYAIVSGRDTLVALAVFLVIQGVKYQLGETAEPINRQVRCRSCGHVWWLEGGG